MMDENQQEETNKHLRRFKPDRNHGNPFDKRPIQPELFPEFCDPETESFIKKVERDESDSKIQASILLKPTNTKEEIPKDPQLKEEFSSVGQIFSHAREKLKLTREEVAKSLHLQIDSLRFIENDELNRLPLADVYMKSHLKSLCHFYALDEKHILQLYQKSLRRPEHSDNKKENFSSQSGSLFVQDLQAKDQNSLKKPVRGKIVWLIATILALTVMAILVLNGHQIEPSLERWLHSGKESEEIIIPEQELERFIIQEPLSFRELPTPKQELE